MNKIYKVVWSKVKHCYVVTSELAKRQTKGCGARSLRMATVSLGVAAALLCTGAVLPIFCESVAEASSEDVSNKTVDITSDTSKKIYGSWAGFSTTDTSNAIWGGFSTESTVDTNYNAVTIGNVTVSGNTVSGGWNMRTGSSTGNSVTVNSGTVHGQVVGGYGWSGNDIKDNSVIVNAGTVNNGINGANGYGTLSGNKVFINPGSTVKDIIGAHHPNYNTYSKIDDNRVSVSGSTVNGSVTGGWISMTATYDNPVTNNKVEITDSEVSGAVNGGGYGGDSYSDNADVEIISGNTVKLTNSKVNNGVRAGATRVASGLIKNNTVELESTDVLGNVWGGYNLGYYDGKAIATLSENKVTMNGGTVGTASASPADEYAEGVVYGAYSVSSSVNTGDVTGNTVTIKSGTVGNTVQAVIGGFTRATGSSGNSGNATGNTVTIEGGTIKGIVRGGASMSSQKTAGEVKENNVVIKGGKFETTYIINKETNPATVTSYRSDVYGGYLEGDGNSGVVQDNTVTISGGDLTDAKIYGGYSNASNAVHNTVEFTKEFTAPERNFITVAGGASGSGNAIKNEVSIGGGTIGRYEYNVYGGYSETGTAGGTADEGNVVTITGGKVGGSAVGGFSKSGAVKNNVVTVSGNETEVSEIRGGSSWTGTVSENTATIQGGWVRNGAYGGFSSDGTANGNKLNISGGTVGGGVYGGDADTAATYNAVTISGDAEISAPYLTGGKSYKNSGGGVATGNTFTIRGGTFSGVAEYSYAITGGYTDQNGTAKDNAVNLTGEVTGLENFELYGYSHAATHSGNELHIGGTKTYDSNGTASVSGGAVWQGKSSDGTVNNKVESVSNFESIVLHNVAWSKTLPVLEATSVNNVITLDITKIQFDQTPSGAGTMTLLKSDSDLSTITLTYSDGTKAITTAGINLGTADRTEAEGVNGVKLTQSINEKVLLATDSKAIDYSCEVSAVSGVAFETMTWGTGRAAEAGVSYAGVTDATVVATNLKFANPEAVVLGATMKMLSGATGLVAGTDITGHTQTFSHKLANDVSLNATLNGTVVRSTAGEIDYKALATTVNSVNLANWKGNASAVVPSGWTGKGVTVSGSFTGPELAANSSRDILTNGASDMFTDDAIADENKYKAGVTFKGDEANGVTLAGTQSKGVKADDGGKKLVYAAGKKDVTAITLGNMKVGTPRDMNTDYNFAGVTTLDASALAFDKPENVNADVNLVTNAAGIPTGMDATAGKDHSQSFEQTAKNNVKLTANLKGAVKTDTNVVKYAYGGKELTKVDLKDWNGNEATFDATGWTKGASATVETDGLSVTVDPGVEKTVLTVSGGVVLTGITVNGEAYQWKDGGESIAETSAENGVKITAGVTTGGGIKGDGNKIIYKGSSKTVTGLEVTSVDFVKDGVARAFKNDYDLTNAAITAASDISVSNTEAMNPGDTMVVVDATNAIKVAGKEKQTLKDFATINAGKAIAFTDQIEGKALTLSGTHQDTLEQNGDKNQILYKVGEKNVTAATFTGEVAWNDSEAYYDATKGKEKYKFATADIDTTNLKVTGKTTKALKKGDAMTLISATGLNAGKVTQPTDAGSIDMNYSEKGITLSGKVAGEVKAADNAIKYEVTGVNVNKADIGSVAWQERATLVDFSDKANNFAGVTTIGTDKFAMTYAKPEEVAAKQSMTLLKANDSLKAIVNEEKAKVEKAYSVTPVDGVTVNAKLTSNVANTNGNVMVTAVSNQASELKFEKVEWTGSNPLIDHSKTLKNVSFNGATVDTSNIDFYKEMYIEADQTTTLVSGFGGEPKDIIGSKYMVGTAFEGEGSATMENGNLIFHTKTSAGVSEQTHKAVMGVEATMGLLATGIGHMDKVLDGLGNLSNVGSDGASVAASFGGGKDRYETNSHVNINSWSAAVGVGARKEIKKGTLQYGIFGEYGKGNYTMHSDVGRSDGDAHYAGGGLMAKWTNKHDVYTEASFRLGRVSDSANDLLRDGAGNAYGYDIHATYYGAHVGLGKVFNYKGGKSLDVYGKFFYTKRDGAEFDAKQHYNLDSVNSSVLRIGARYGTTDKKWNWYGGLAYEYEFDGEAKGTVNGTEIRAASIKGSSVRGEFGMRMDATKDNPWRTDISIYGYGGKHRGFGGSVNVAYTF